jgi:tetratricopeptide (TPR) repeat protein
MSSQPVKACLKTLSLPTYGLGEPNQHPIFVEKRVYQGSSGKVYPVPFVDKVLQDDPPVEKTYQAAHLENEYVRLVILPEIGGRIFLGQDKTNADYDFFYRQDVIKPALVGLAGPWISGGVEFNWPQHHRPGTYMPADVFIEAEADGAQTVWLSEHDPLNRLKGMHGIRVRPGSCLIELRGRLFNRTPLTQTFLWWANVAARVHDRYQSFFPPDVQYVADHAVRAMSSFPVADGTYYGVDYGNRPGANDLSWYKNIPVPTSYMVCRTDYDFFGGYDYDAQGGFIHVANKHIAPGKKQWTWGNDAFGRGWDRELTDTNGPYIELMAGVYTDNQPDFSYLLPYETKTFSQFWWPFRNLGPVQNANEKVAVRLVVDDRHQLDLGLAVSQPYEGVEVVLTHHGRVVLQERLDVSPDKPWQCIALPFEGDAVSALQLVVCDKDGNRLISFRPVDADHLPSRRPLATEPPEPEAITDTDELFFTGEHLELYRHPTRYPEAYWEEVLKRDPGDARCNLALGKKALARGEFDAAAAYLNHAVDRLTARHPNPVSGEAHYFLGLTRRFQGQLHEAYALLYKAAWNYAWRSAAYYELACLDLRQQDLETAMQHLESSLDTNRQHNKAHILKAAILRKRGKHADARAVLLSLLKIDPLDHWARFEWSLLQGDHDVSEFCRLTRNDAQTILDVAFDYADAGLFEEAAGVLECHHAHDVTPVSVPNPLEKSQLTHYTLAWLYALTGHENAGAALKAARSLPPDFCFPSRLGEYAVLQWAVSQPGADRNAAYGLGNFCYDRKRHREAIQYWQLARQTDPRFATVHRNLGIAGWNILQDGKLARQSYQQALACAPEDALLISEYDQLCKKLGDSEKQRLDFLQKHRKLVLERDDCSVEMAALLNQNGFPQEALDLLCSRTYHPWEGGEGKVLRQYTLARLLLGQKALLEGFPEKALEHFERAMVTPDNLGEKYHPLQARADVNYWIAKALAAMNRPQQAQAKFNEAACEEGDFQDMAVTAFSELTYYKGLALDALGQHEKAAQLFGAMKAWAAEQKQQPAKIDYFATSLPNLLVFEEDMDRVKRQAMDKLMELADAGLSKIN